MLATNSSLSRSNRLTVFFDSMARTQFMNKYHSSNQELFNKYFNGKNVFKNQKTNGDICQKKSLSIEDLAKSAYRTMIFLYDFIEKVNVDNQNLYKALNKQNILLSHLITKINNHDQAIDKLINIKKMETQAQLN
ncbi:MAG: hypothetical protein MK033_09785 [Candidatus Caenarcaniphilales bacterium]|nr:hypothetical protein [Candidatus Caenarcaniphilales bacterium]